MGTLLKTNNNSIKEELSDTFECCLCHQKFKGYGNNPYPLVTDKGARCCDKCNYEKVIPARIALYDIKDSMNENLDNSNESFNNTMKKILLKEVLSDLEEKIDNKISN